MSDKHFPPFATLSASDLKILEDKVVSKKFLPGEIIIKAGDPHEYFYVIVEGSAEVYVEGRDDEDHTKVARLLPGDILGEISLVDGSIYSATVKAASQTTVKAYNIKHFKEPKKKRKREIFQKLLASIARDLAVKLRRNNSVVLPSIGKQLHLAKEVIHYGNFLAKFLMAWCFGMYLMHHAFITASFLQICTLWGTFAFLSFWIVHHCEIPWQEFGFTTESREHIIKEAVLWSVAFALFALIVKLIFINFFATYENEPLFNGSANSANVNAMVLLRLALTAVGQEIIVRGLFQSALAKFLSCIALLQITGKMAEAQIPLPSESVLQSKVSYLVWPTILLSNLLYGAMFLPVSSKLALLVFVPGLFWSWLYSRHPSLIGVCISHILLGAYLKYCLGFEFLLG